MSCKQKCNVNKIKQQGKKIKMENIIKKIPLPKLKQSDKAKSIYISNANDCVCLKYDCVYPRDMFHESTGMQILVQSRLDADFM